MATTFLILMKGKKKNETDTRMSKGGEKRKREGGIWKRSLLPLGKRNAPQLDLPTFVERKCSPTTSFRKRERKKEPTRIVNRATRKRERRSRKKKAADGRKRRRQGPLGHDLLPKGRKRSWLKKGKWVVKGEDLNPREQYPVYPRGGRGKGWVAWRFPYLS